MLLKIAAFVVVAHFLVRFLLRVFKRQGRVYYLTPARQFGMVFWSLISFWLAVVMFGLLLREHTDTHLEQILAIALGGILFLFSLPTLLVHWQYWRHERESALELEKETRTVLLLRPGQKYFLPQNQIRNILETRCSSKSVFWKDYGYLTLTLQDGRTVTITSLLLNLNQLKALWPHVPLQTRTKWVCFL
ncbi:MAG: hypothetical protein ACO1OQ_12030 [Rufibacter sp.]